MPRALATAQSVSTDGLPAPASSCDSVDFDTPAARASSLSDTPARRRSARRLLAICASGDGVTSPAASGPPICTGPVYQTFVRQIEQTSRATHTRPHTPSSHLASSPHHAPCELGGKVRPRRQAAITKDTFDIADAKAYFGIRAHDGPHDAASARPPAAARPHRAARHDRARDRGGLRASPRRLAGQRLLPPASARGLRLRRTRTRHR